MQISERQRGILDTIIREYVESARPVSSQWLGEKYDFGICPASIRIEMQKLTDNGFLAQPHTSAGRVPTDKGYRFFVNRLLEGQVNGPKIGLDFEPHADIDNDFEDLLAAMRQLAQSIAATSESLVMGYLADQDVIFKEGWEEVLRQPEFNQKNLMDNFLDYLSYLENNIEKIRPEGDFDLFIGHENAHPKAREFSMMSLALEPAPEQEVIFSIVGPKRMAYDKNIALANEIIKMFETL
jgi:heat-inducible transcriptional repressor